MKTGKYMRWFIWVVAILLWLEIFYLGMKGEIP